MNRRMFIKVSAAAGLTLGTSGLRASYMQAKTKPTICAFTKTIDFLSDDDLCGMLAECGFSGLDLTLRKGGRVAPEKAMIELPKMVSVARRYGLSVPMAVTDINDVSKEGVDQLVKTMADNGITHYRFAYWDYDYKESIEHNLDRFRRMLEQLCSLNQRFKIHGAIQNHVGNRLGASIWDAWEVIRQLDPEFVGIQYDYRHALPEGYQSWVNGLRAASSHIRCSCIKDFVWTKNDKGRTIPQSVPLGEGLCDYPTYFKLVDELKIGGPVSIHYEYPLLTKEEMGSLSSSAKREKITPLVRSDIQKLNQYMQPDEASK